MTLVEKMKKSNKLTTEIEADEKDKQLKNINA